MEVDEKPTEDYGDIGGLDKQIQELREAIVLPITHKDRFVKLGIKPPKGVLLHGPPGRLGRGGQGRCTVCCVVPSTCSTSVQLHPSPLTSTFHKSAGTGKTLIARACAAQTNATFLKLAGTSLVQMFIGDGAKMVRDAFALAKEKQPCIIFIDEIDSIGGHEGGAAGAQGARRPASAVMLLLISPPTAHCPRQRAHHSAPICRVQARRGATAR